MGQGSWKRLALARALWRPPRRSRGRDGTNGRGFGLESGAPEGIWQLGETGAKERRQLGESDETGGDTRMLRGLLRGAGAGKGEGGGAGWWEKGHGWDPREELLYENITPYHNIRL